MKSEIKNYLKFLITPLLIIFLGVVVGRSCFLFLKNWAWLPVVLTYWIAVGVILYLDYKRSGTRPCSYFKGGRFNLTAAILALIVGIIPLPIFLINYHLFDSVILIILWIVVAIINPLFEECFWRGYMLDKFPQMPFWIKTVVSSTLFAIAHPLIWGLFSANMLTAEMFISVLIMGLTWSYVYRKSKSLLLPCISHTLVDMLSCSVLAFMNLLPVMSNL